MPSKKKLYKNASSPKLSKERVYNFAKAKEPKKAEPIKSFMKRRNKKA